MNVKTTFLYDKIHENVFVEQFTKFEQKNNKICKLNKILNAFKQFSRIWFESLIKFFFSWLCFIKCRIQCFHEKRHHDRHLCKRSDFYKIRFDDHFSIEKRFRQTIRNEWFKFVYLLSRHDDFQNSTFQIIIFESKRLRRTNVTKS
jgi:hypothetical protein